MKGNCMLSTEMADIFEKKHVIELLKERRIVFFGDSNVRCIYKDLVWLLNDNSLIPHSVLKTKGEKSFQGDKLIGRCNLNASRDYSETREYSSNGCSVEFFFVPRCFHQNIKTYLNNVKTKALPAPDVVIMNSTIWDLTRWGPEGAKQFQKDLVSLMQLLKKTLPDDTMFIWTTAFPPGKQIKKQCLLIKQVEFLEHTVRFDIMEANLYARNVVVSNGYDLLDLHYHLRMQIHRRFGDGLHFMPLPMRFLTNILLTHIALSWGFPLPKNIDNSLLNRYINMVHDHEDELTSTLIDTVEKVDRSSCENVNANIVVNNDKSKKSNTTSKNKNKGKQKCDEILNKPKKKKSSRKNRKNRRRIQQMRNQYMGNYHRSCYRDGFSVNISVNNNYMNRYNCNQTAQILPWAIGNNTFDFDLYRKLCTMMNDVRPQNCLMGGYMNQFNWNNGYFPRRY